MKAEFIQQDENGVTLAVLTITDSELRVQKNTVNPITGKASVQVDNHDTAGTWRRVAPLSLKYRVFEGDTLKFTPFSRQPEGDAIEGTLLYSELMQGWMLSFLTQQERKVLIPLGMVTVHSKIRK